jgi:membrane protein YdbS with pleckstrin-like domain
MRDTPRIKPMNNKNANKNLLVTFIKSWLILIVILAVLVGGAAIADQINDNPWIFRAIVIVIIIVFLVFAIIHARIFMKLMIRKWR